MLSDFETKLLGVMMMAIMLGMGASLTFKDFAIALRKPAGVGIGPRHYVCADTDGWLCVGHGAGAATGLCHRLDPDGLPSGWYHQQYFQLLQQGRTKPVDTDDDRLDTVCGGVGADCLRNILFRY